MARRAPTGQIRSGPRFAGDEAQFSIDERDRYEDRHDPRDDWEFDEGWENPLGERTATGTDRTDRHDTSILVLWESPAAEIAAAQAARYPHC